MTQEELDKIVEQHHHYYKIFAEGVKTLLESI